MAVPVIENCVAALADRLRTITQANGYEVNIGPIIRVSRFQLAHGTGAIEHMSVIVSQANRDHGDFEGNDVGPGRKDYTLSVNIDVIIVPPETDKEPWGTIANRITADIEKALKSADTWWTAVAGFLNFDLDGPFPIPEEVGMDGMSYQAMIHYGTLFTDPYSTA